MKPLLLRSEDPPADDVVVVRAGVLNRDDAIGPPNPVFRLVPLA